jgi:hypothetical protein
MPDPITLHARPTRQLLVRTRLRLFLRTRLGLQSVLAGLLAPPAVWLFWAAYTDQPWPSSSNFIFIVGPLYAGLMLWSAAFSGLRKAATVAYLRDGVEFTLSEEGVSHRTPTAEGRHGWEHCTGALELSDVFAVRLGNAAYLLPVADLRPEDVGPLRALLRSKLGKKAKLRGA